MNWGDPVRNHPQIVNGAKFVVEYWEKDPQRSILYMDRPVKDSVIATMPHESRQQQKDIPDISDIESGTAR